ncbi:hypothetical protein B5S28_g94 [[Candida] boidinii]|nr:hypothetical protein B5S28_g94 [[Candida] boidinii]OWB71042.1 hypothetical protein B5S31_g724 [[Candida] boidinii]GMF34335.1 unnamed protein product [[Candida] boidinii]
MSVDDAIITWEQLEQIVHTGDLKKLHRDHAGMKKYNDFKQKLKSANIDLTVNLLVTQLKWISPKDYKLEGTKFADIKEITPIDKRLFANSSDVTILRNDFPYHFEANVKHLVVWVKNQILPDPESPHGDISNYDKSLIEKYINKTFVEYLNIDRKDILWYKNWAALQSVRTIPHIHVILRNVSEEKILKVLYTGGKEIDYDHVEPKL